MMAENGDVEAPSYEDWMKELHFVQTVKKATPKAVAKQPATEDKTTKLLDSVQSTLNENRRVQNRMDYAMGKTGLKTPETNLGWKGKSTLGFGGNVVETKRRNYVTGGEEKVYLTESGNEYGSRAMADVEQGQLDEARFMRENKRAYLMREKERIEREMNQRRGEVKRAEEEEYKKIWDGPLKYLSSMPRGGGVGFNPSADNLGVWGDKKYKTLNAQLKQVEDALATLDEAEAGKKSDAWIADSSNAWERNAKKLAGFGGGAWRGLAHSVGKISTWDFGITDMETNKSVLDAANAVDKGTEATKEDQELLDLVAYKNMVGKESEPYLGYGYTAGSITGESLPFMLEMAINPASGVGKGAMKASMRGMLKKYGKEKLKSNFKKYLLAKAGARVAGDVAGAHAMALTTGQGRVIADTMRRLTGDVQYGVNDNGQIVYSGRKVDVDGLAEAYLKSFESQAIENHSEMLGEYFAPLLTRAGKAIGKPIGKGLEKLRLGGVNQFIEDVGASKTAKLIDDFSKKTQWNGSIGEYAEEVAGGIENAMIVGDQTLDTDEQTGVFNLEKNIETFLGVGLMGGFMFGAKLASYRGPKRGALQEMEAAGNRVDRALGGKMQARAQWGEWRSKLLLGNEEEKKNTLREIMDNEKLPIQFRNAVADFSRAAQKYEGLCRAEQSKRLEGSADPVGSSLDDAADAGYELNDPQEMTRTRLALESERERMAAYLGVEADQVDATVGENLFDYVDDLRNRGVTGEELNRVMDYARARSRYEGMQMRLEDDTNTRIDNVHANMARYAHRENGTVQTGAVKTKDGSRPVWIVSGNLVFEGEGKNRSVNPMKSDESIFVIDAKTGQVEMHPATDFVSLGEPVSAEEVNAYYESSVREQMKKAFEANTHAEDGELAPANETEGAAVEPAEGNATEPAKPAYEVGDVVTLETEDGPVSVEVQAVTADGVEVRTDEPWRGQVVQVIPTEEFEGMMKKPVEEAGVGVEESSATESNHYTEGSPERVEAGDNLIVTDEEGNDRSLKVVRRVSMRPSEKGGLEPQEDANGKIVELVDDATGETVRMWDSELAERTKGYMRPQQGVMPSPKSTEGEGVEQAEQAAPAAEPAQPKRNEIPVDEKTGEPVYEAADPGAAWDALVEEAEGDEELAMEAVNSMVRDMEEKLKKAKNAKLRAGATAHEKMEAQKERKRRIAEAEERLESWKRIAGVKAERAAAAEASVAESPAVESPVAESPAVESPAVVETPAAEEATPVQEGARGGVQVPHADSAGQEATQDSVTGAAPVAEQTGTTPKGVEAIPTRKNNKGEEEVLYHKVPVARTMADLYDGGMDQEEIDGFVEANSAEAAREVKRIEGKKPKMTTNKAKYMEAKRAWQAELDEAKEKEAYWKEVGKEVKRVTHRDEAPVSAEGRGHAAALGEDMPKDEPMDVYEVVASALGHGRIKITPESFRAETGYSVNDQKKYPGMVASAENGGVSVERAAEMLMEDADMAGFPSDDYTIRQAIIDVLQDGHPAGYISRRREEARRRAAERDEREREEYYQDRYGMNADDGMAYEETAVPNALNQYGGVSEDELAAQSAEAAEAERMKREEDEQGNRAEDGGQQIAGKEEGAGNEAASEVEEMPAAHEPAVDSSMPKTSFTQDEAADFVDKMEARAESVPEMELTIENWDSLFGEDGRVETPIGEVKMGENQFAKLMRQGRNGKLGMIKPTLESPDIIIEQASMAKEGDVTERPSSYLFIKAFTKPDGGRFYYFTSVSVSRDGKEVIISNQEKSRNKILRLMTEESVIWRTPNDAATSSAEKQGLDYAHPNNAEDETKGSGITPQSTSSAGKVTESQETEQGNEVVSEVEEMSRENSARETHHVAEEPVSLEKWKLLNGEERMQEAGKHPLLREEIENASTDDVLKTNALDYLNGNQGMIQSVSYLKVYEDVRYTNRTAAADSGATDSTQLDTPASGNEQRVDVRDRGQSGNSNERMDRGTGEDGVPAEGGPLHADPSDAGGITAGIGNASSESLPVRGSVLQSGDSRSDVHTGSSVRSGEGRNVGGRTGRKSDTASRKNSKRGVQADTARNAKDDRGLDSNDSLDKELADAMKEFDGVLDEFKRAGKEELSMSIAGMSSRQMEVLPRLIAAGAKVGYTFLKKGVHNFAEWAKQMRKMLGGKLADAGLSENEIDAFITEMWKCKLPIDGEVHTLEEWASIIGKAELRKKVGESLEEKRKAQAAAEPVAVKVCDRNNIAETLPFLLPQQQEDVMKAETQFFDDSHNDRDHAFGKGYMFTNGTGTGKTYTGLGIVKRFIKQGKGRILILTPSQTKVKDWVDDAKNLGIELNDLDAVAKAKKDGATATTEKGEGAVITTYANFRQNKALLEDLFDLIVYDESHRLLENKNGIGTAGSLQHYKLSNRNDMYAYLRLKEINPVWNAYQTKIEEFNAEREKLIERLKKEYKIANELVLGQRGVLPHVLNGNWTGDMERKFPELAKLRNEVNTLGAKYEKEIKPRLEEEAKANMKHTKVVFLSATPFNTRENLDYAEGYIFSYPENDRQVGYANQSPRSQFYLEHFGAGYRWRYNRLESSSSNAAAVSKQEVEFSDYLQHTLQTMSGRIIDSPYDYSRDFPTVTMEKAEAFNAAMEELSRDESTRAGYSEVMGDYNYSSALFESMKVSQIIPRLKAHLERGRKVVVFHRRVDSREPLRHPFAAIFAESARLAEKESDAQEKAEKKKRIASLKRKYADLLVWEQGLDLRMPREQLADAFGKDDVLFFSGKEGEKAKKKAVKDFNSDTSGKNIMVIQEASGKEGISLHDTTGGHQRVLVTLALPQSPITALQIEGRIYRIGNKSNAIFEYPLLGLNAEMMLFGQKFNEQVSTTENLALGSQARNLRESFARGVEEHSGNVDIDGQGVGGKELDAPSVTETDAFDRAVLDYYTNQKLAGRRDSREGQDYYPTPEPLGYMMNQWGQIGEGESVLEPSAGHGAIARYVPKENLLTAVEPSQRLFSKLQIKAGGNGRKFENDVFENYNVVNKHDVVLMNPPFGVGGRMAVDHVAKAFQHLDEGGRVVAIIPRGSTDKKFEKWYEGQKDAVLTAEIGLPDITFERAGTSVNCRVVVIDKVTNNDLRGDAASRAVHVDLSGMHFDKIEDFFEEIRDIRVPERTIDYKAKMKKKATPVARELRGMKGIKKVELNEDWIFVDGRGVWTSLQWGDWQGEALTRHLANEYVRFRKSEEYAVGRGNDVQTAVYGELKGLCCKLAGMTEDEMQRYILKKESGEALYREDDDLGKVREERAHGGAQAVSEAEAGLRDALVDVARAAGVEVVTDSKEGQRVLDEVNGKARLSAKQKRALETASLGNDPRSLTVVSSATGAKVLNNLDALAASLENSATQPKIFLGQVANALGASNKGSSSQYATFETKNGTVVTIRLANHNASTKRMDDAGQDNAISIVITNKPNEGIQDGGDAHIVEFYYNALKLGRADGHPLAEIVRSIQQALYSGEYKDTTGLAERQEVNTTFENLREHRVFHGSGAEFDAFDHSHMGEGEGAQAYGWGTYVTEVEGIGRAYARNPWQMKINELESNISRAKEKLPFMPPSATKTELENNIKEWEEELAKLENGNKHLYTVEIPEDNGENYLHWEKPLTREQLSSVAEALKADGWSEAEGNHPTFTKNDNKIVLNERAAGSDVYAELEEAMGSQQKASEFLSSIGFTGISYPAQFRSGGREDNSRNFVIFNEKDAQITDHVRFFKTENGEAYGFTVGGKVYLDPKIATTETAVHELTHLWADMLRKENPKEWKHVVELMKGTPVWDEVKAKYPELKTEDEIADEVLAHYSGRRGAERLRAEQQRLAREEGVSMLDRASAVAAIERVKDALNSFWKKVADLLGIHFKSAEEVADAALADILNGRVKLTAAEGMKEDRKELVAVHNITKDKLKQAMELGGFPMPSIAITKAGVGHTSFGDISLVFDKESINPTDKRNKVYGEDAWTPVFPGVGYKLNDKKTAEIYRRANNVAREKDLPFYNPVMFHPDNYINKVGANGVTDLVEYFKNSYDAKQMYLAEMGNAVTEYVKREEEKYSPKHIRLYEKMLEEIGLERLQNESLEELRDEIKRLYKEYGDVDIDQKPQRVERAYLDGAKRKAVDYALHGNRNVVDDVFATQREIDGRIDQQQFEEWLGEMFSGIVEKKGVRNDKDAYTPSGNARKWEQLYDEITLDNVVAAMQKQAAKGGEGLFGRNIFGSAQAEYKSIDEIRKAAKERIRTINEEEYQTQRSAITDRLSAIEIPGSGSGFLGSMEMEQHIHDAVSKSHTAKGIHKYLKKFYPGITMETAEEIADIVQDIQHMSARYFEAKPYRAVGFDEVKLAVVPSDMDAALKERLEQMGIEVRTYASGDQAQRKRVVDEATEELRIRFQLVGEKGEKNMVSPLEMSEEEKHERGVQLVNAPAVDVASGQIVKTDKLSARKAAEQWWGEHVPSPLHYQTEIGEVVIDDNSIGNSLAHRYGQAKLDAITSLEEGFVNAVYLGSMKDFSRDGNVFNHYFAYPINYDGKRNYVFCRALNDANGNRLYVHEVFVADKIEKGNTLQTAASQPHGGIALYKDILANVLDAAKVVEEFENPNVQGQESDDASYREVEQGELLDELRKASKEGRTVRVYRTMQVIDGKLYSPMAKKVAGQETSEIKFRWEAAEEHPELARRGDGSKAMPNEDSFYITIDKGQGKGALTVAYNPYTHTSRTVLNDQFSSAFVRPNLVVVEVEVPESELEGLYKAEKAKDSVGEMSWHSGAVSGKLAELGNPRKVILSRYDRPVRILTKKEEAELIAKQLEGTGIAMPYNLVTPQVREELEKLGVKIDEKPSGSVSKNASFGKAEYVTDEQIEAMNGRLQANAVSSPEAMTEAARALSEQLGVPVEIVTDVDSITHPNEAVEVKRRRAKGWYDKRTGKVAIVVPNHLDVEDVAATVFHEVVAHRGLRELVGEQGYDEFLMEVFNHSKADVRERMMALAGKHGWDIPKAVDEYLGGLAERGFGDFSEAERGMWTWLKEKVLEAIDKFIGTLKLPKSVKLGDNELRYLLWRSHENLRAGREGMVKRAMDVAKRYELGLLENEAGERMIDGLETYRSAENRGNTRALPIRERAKAIAHLKPVLVERNEMSKEELRQIYNALPDAVKDGRSISFYHSAFKKIYKEKGLFKHVVPYLKDLLEGSVFAYSEGDNLGGMVRPDKTVHKEHPNVSAFDNYVGKIRLDGKDFYVRFTVQQSEGNNSGTHSFMVTEVDLYEKTANGLSLPITTRARGTTDGIVDAKLRQFFDEARREDKASEEEDLYRTAYHEAAARDAYERRVKSGLYQSREALQDSMLGLRTAMEEVLKAEGSGYSGRVEDIPGFENAYLGENRLSSVNQAEVDEFGRRLFKPLLEIAASFGSSKEARQALTDYMMAKHGLERNALMRERAKKKAMEELEGDRLQKKLDSIEKRDFAGLTALTGEKKVADAEQAARKMVADFEQTYGDGGQIDALWKAVRGVTGATLKKMKDSGLITKEQFDEISGMYDFYIPLRGFDGQTAEDVYDYLGHGGNGSAFTSPIKKAEGRKSKADDPFAYMAAMAESAIMQGNRNVLVKQKFLNFVLNHPSDLVSVSDLWLRYDAAAGEWRVAQSGDIVGTEKLEEGDSPEEVERKMAVFEERMQAEAEAHPKEYKRQKEHPEIPYRVVEKQDLREHQVIVKRNGRDYVLTINGSPRAAQALNGLTNPNLDVSGVAGTLMNGVRNTTNYLSQVYTTRNPNFVGSNWARDAIYSNIMAGLKEDGEYGLKFSKAWLEANPGSMSKLYYLYEHGELDMNNEKQRLFAEFMANGGETGYMSFRQIEERKNEIERQLKLYGGKMSLKKGWSDAWNLVDYANRVVENQSRFAAYMASRRSGRTIDRSIYDAKEITVNFNKKGAGSTFYNAKNQTLAGKVAGGVSGIGRFGFAFWNAAIQGTTNFARFVKRNPKKGVAFSLATMALGYVVPLLASIFHDDDDDKEGSGYFDLPDAVRRDNFVFRFPGMDSWITIPLPVEYRALYGLGELTATAMYRASIGMPMTAGEIAGQAMGQISQLMPLDLSEGGGMDFTWGASGNFNALAPSAVKPVAEAWTNKSWTGLPVYKDTPYNKQDPEWTKAFKNTNTFLVKMCKQLNEWTGGDSVKGGAVDLNPAVMEHLLKGYLGGYMQTANQFGKLGETVFGDRENEFRNWPVVSRFLQEGDERTKWRAVTERYFNLKKEAEETDRQLKRYKKLTELGEDHQADIDELIKTDAYKRMEVYDSFENDIQKIQDVLKRNDLSDEERKQVEGELNEIRLELLKAVDELGNLTGLGTGRLGAVTGDLLAE